MSSPTIYLASRSPRRRELLEQIGVYYETLAVDLDENPRAGEAPGDYVVRLAIEKGRAGWRSPGRRQRRPVLGADTCIALDEKVLGKPNSPAHARDMLVRLSGRDHQVLSAVALVQGEREDRRLCTSTVRFRPLAPGEIAAYCETGEPLDKAGAYAIQGRAAAFIEHLEGSYSGVMGLPLFETAELLAAFSTPVIPA